MIHHMELVLDLMEFLWNTNKALLVFNLDNVLQLDLPVLQQDHLVLQEHAVMMVLVEEMINVVLTLVYKNMFVSLHMVLENRFYHKYLYDITLFDNYLLSLIIFNGIIFIIKNY